MWAQMDLNHRPLPYQGSALTKLSYGPEIACRDYLTTHPRIHGEVISPVNAYAGMVIRLPSNLVR